MRRRKGKAGAVAGGEQHPILIRQRARDNGTNRMEDMARGEIIARRELRPARLLGMSLPLHDSRALCAQLQARCRVNCVVDAAVTRDEAAEEHGVRRVYNRICCKARDVALPEDNARVGGHGGERHHVHHTALLPLRREQFVLQAQELLRERARRTDIHQRAQETPLCRMILPHLHRLSAVLRHLIEKQGDEFLNTHARTSDTRSPTCAPLSIRSTMPSA